jgi:O-antigen/teichoic acid export membrane protein
MQKKESREKSLVKNTLILSLGTSFPKLMSFITLPLLTAFLTKAEYGTYDLITVLVMFLLPIATLQIHTGAFRYLIECRDDHEQTKRIITNALTYAVSLSIICLVVTAFFLRNTERNVYIILYLFFDMYLIVIQQVARGTGKNMQYSISAIINSVCYMLLTVLLVWNLQEGLAGALFAMLGGVVIASIYLTWKLHLLSQIKFKYISKNIIKMLLAYSWPIVPNSLSNWVLNLSGRLIVTTFLGVEANAILAVANKLPNLLTIFQASFTYAWQESASLTVKDKDASLYYKNMFCRIANFLTGGLAILIGLSPVIFNILVKGDYSEAYPHIAILYFAIFFSCIASFLAGIYAAYMKTVNIGITTIIAAVCNITINLLFVKSIGIYAASISTLISYILLTVYRMHNIQSFQKIEFDVKQLVIDSILLIVMLVVFWINRLGLNILNFIFGVIVAFSLNRNIVKSIMNVLRNKLYRRRK